MVLAEASRYPMGYVMVMEDDECRSLDAESQLCDLSHFGQFGSNELVEAWLTLPQLKPTGACPLAYRS